MIQISWLCISNVLFDLNDKILPESNRLISIQLLYTETGPRTCIYLQAVQFLCLQSLSAEKKIPMPNCYIFIWKHCSFPERKCHKQVNLTFSKTALRRRSTLTILDKSPIFDSNSRNRFQTSTDN